MARPWSIDELDDPWGEKTVAARQALRPRDLVRDHLEALETSSKVTGWFRAVREPEVLDVTPENVIAALNRVGIVPVVMGTHGLVGYRSESRATDDVDVLVPKRETRKAVRTLEAEFPYLEVVDLPQVARFLNPVSQKVVIDVMKPDSQAIKSVFRHTIAIGKTHRVPELEMALACKFVAMIAPNRRRAKRMVDLGDFMNVVERNRSILDLKKLERLGDKVHPRGGKMVLRLIADFDAGLPIQL